MKKLWLEDAECTGCGMCVDVCPQKAITLESNALGFMYPNINKKCIDCNLCEIKCKARFSVREGNSTNPYTYAAWSRDEQLRYYSTSGGVFGELAKYILKSGGSVVGARYNDNNLVEHILVSNEQELEQIRQSKYIQSNLAGIYALVKKELISKNIVMFCGTPCHVAALYAFLEGVDCDNLITVDFICRGVNSPKAFIKWLEEIEQNEKSKVTKVWFKYKDEGWKRSPKRTRIDFLDGHYIVKSFGENLFMEGYLSQNLYMRKSCSHCNFKGVPRKSDITLADFWGIDEKIDDDRGTSLVLVNTEAGKKIFNCINSGMVIYRRDFSEIRKGNKYFESSINLSSKSELFLSDLDNMKFSEAIKKYQKSPFIKLIDKIKTKLLKVRIKS